jgi:hypothetical protein
MAGDDRRSADATFAPAEVLSEALAHAAAVALAEPMAQPLGVVLDRAHGELRGGELSGATRRLLQTALSAGHHNTQLSVGTRTALAAVAAALRGLGGPGGPG